MTKSLALAVFLLTTCAAVQAYPGYYVVTVYDNQGQKSIDFRYWTIKFPGRTETVWPELGVGYGVTSRWYTELYASYIGSSASKVSLDTWNWQNDVLLTQGQYPFDLAIHTMLAREHISQEGYTLDIGPALQTDVGRVQLNGNVFLERVLRSENNGTTQLQYQWQTKYRWKPALEFGLQGFGELGDWNHWAPRDKQSHRIGPALFGSLSTGPAQTLKYQVSYLTGSIYGRHGNMLSLRLQYVFD
ncbi:hypothetical protein [Undibacterium terreum]|uniref:DUF2490 domain-containing protein n=1 Tax=Undibacterium terreum TaxID=1224302 RepID=A0A916UHM0_9BURK|nr:hypothetical protein [Undibacterium terreum]GGC73657.1 hypothetical protein GCM10011396_21060 [Undibacterium terreum]